MVSHALKQAKVELEHKLASRKLTEIPAEMVSKYNTKSNLSETSVGRDIRHLMLSPLEDTRGKIHRH
jgi:hypothetical protein